MSAVPIDTERILRETPVVAVEYHASLTSTNDRGAQCAAMADARLPLLIVAGQQTAGRGRGTNRWWTGAGSLAFSLVLGPQKWFTTDRQRSPLISLAVGVAVAECLHTRASAAGLGIRWPNDVFAGPCKVAGILIEVLPRGHYVLGVGVNTNNTAADAPAELQARVATLRDLTGETHDQTALLVDVLGRLERNFALLAATPAQVARRADALCLQRGQRLTVQDAREEVSGPCRGIADDGALLLETPRGVRAIYAGIVRGGE